MDMRPFFDGIENGQPGAGGQRAALPAVREWQQATGEPTGAYAGDRYRREGPRWSVLALIVCLHGVALAVLVSARYQVERQPTERLQTYALDALEPPPPPRPAEAVPDAALPPAARVTTPEPPIELPRTTPLHAATPNLAQIDLAPARVSLAVPAAPAPPAPRPAPPAPVSPPDFRAGQLDNPGPSYPYLSRKAREEGVVTLRVLVSADGRAKQLSIEGSSGFERLDEEALKTVRRWRFLPARRAGEAVEAWVLVPVTFALG